MVAVEAHCNTLCLFKVEYKEVDTDLEENTFWKQRYKYEIPVVHFNGKLLMKHRFNEQTLLDALNNVGGGKS